MLCRSQFLLTSPSPALPHLFMEEVGDRVERGFNQGHSAAQGNRACQRPDHAKGNGHVQNRECHGFFVCHNPVSSLVWGGQSALGPMSNGMPK